MNRRLLSIGIVFIAVIFFETVDADGGEAGAALSAATTAAASSCDTPEGARQCAVNEGLNEKATQVAASAKIILASATLASGQGATILEMPQIQAMKEAAIAYANKYSYCVNTQNIASNLCVEKSSPHLQDGLNVVNTLLAGVGSMAVNDKCSMMSKAMNMAQGVLTAYTAACSAARAACEASCSLVMAKLNAVKDLNKHFKCIPPVPPVGSPTACVDFEKTVAEHGNKINLNVLEDLSQSNVKSTAVKNNACTYSYVGMLASAGAGIFSVVKAFGESNNCDNESKGDTTLQAGANPLVVPGGEICNDPKNAKLPECICKANPRTPGCANILEKANENSASRLAAGGLGAGGSSSSRKTDGSGFDGTPGTDPIEHREINDAGGGGLPGAPMGGGSAGLGSGGGGGAGGAPVDGDSGNGGPDLDQYASGFSGGSGGKYGSGFSRNGGSKYRAYLPGGAKDPRRGVAGQGAWAKEVTGQGGKSNWEKVKERYIDNKSTLLNN